MTGAQVRVCWCGFPNVFTRASLTDTQKPENDEVSSDRPECFSFITDNLVMVASLNDLCLNIYDLDKTSSDGPKSCSFMFPALQDLVTVISITIRGDQSSMHTPHPASKVPFYTSHENKVLAISYMFLAANRTYHYLLLVPQSTITNRAFSAEAQSHRLQIPWECWGTQGTRFIELSSPLNDTWVRCAYGQKFVIGHPQPGPQEFEEVQLYDFNQFALKKARSNGSNDHNAETLLRHSEVVSEVFLSPVLTSAPCQIRKFKLPLRYTIGDRLAPYRSIMLNEDGLVAVSVSLASETI